MPVVKKMHAVKMRTQKSLIAFVTILCFVASVVRGEFGPCTYEESACSCKMGDASSGICFDRQGEIIGGQVNCTSRYCKAGWTCSCKDRTHLCDLREKQALIPDTRTKAIGVTATCRTEPKTSAGGPVLSLGTFRPSISRSGLLANQCNRLAWWLNGDLYGNYGDDSITAENIDEAIDLRSNHSLLELRRGDLVAFRFKAGSYYCYNSFSNFIVDGEVLNTSSPDVTTHFNRAFVTNWFSPTTNVTYATDETTAALTEFVPLRDMTLVGNNSIVPGEDMWSPVDGSLDNAVSNYYYRIQL